MSNENTYLSCFYVAVFLFVILFIGLISAMFGFPELDEGILIQHAKAMNVGLIPYKDFPVEYGPLLLNLNYVIFNTFGFSHTTSRLAVVSISYLTFLILCVSVKKQTKGTFLENAIFPAFWFITASRSFSESLHPGWYMALILSLQAYFLASENKRYGYVLLGLLSGLMLGLKPHIALFGVLSISSLFLANTRYRLFKIVTQVLYLISIYFVIEGSLNTLSLIYIIPFALNAYVLFTNCGTEMEGSSIKPLLIFLLGFFLIGLSIYIPAIMSYGYYSMRFSMLDLPRLAYPNLYHPGARINVFDFKALHEILAVLSLYLLLIFGLYKRSEKVFFYLLLSISIVTLSIPQLLSLHGFIVSTIIILKLLENRFDLNSKLLNLISNSQLLHLHPVIGSQVYYSTPLIWAQVGMMVKTTLKDNRHLKILVAIIGVISLINLPIVGSLVKSEKISFLDQRICNEKYMLVADNYKQELRESLLDFKVNYSQDFNGELVQTIPNYYSVNICLDVNSSSYLVTTLWPFLNKDTQLLELEKIKKAKFILVLENSARTKSDGVDGILSSNLFSNYKLVDDGKISRDGAFSVYQKRINFY